MSYCCGKHGWRHLLNPCPFCSPFSELPKSVSQICFEVGNQIESDKKKYIENKYLSLVEKYVDLVDKYMALKETK